MEETSYLQEIRLEIDKHYYLEKNTYNEVLEDCITTSQQMFTETETEYNFHRNIPVLVDRRTSRQWLLSGQKE
jgi:hypothetical protein